MILVTGGTGNVGRELVRELDRCGTPVRLLVRDPGRAAPLPPGAERVVADLDEPSTLPPAFEGVGSLFLLTPGIGTEHARHAVAAAVAAGVRRIVLLSSINAIGDPVPAMGRWHHDREQIVRASGIPATILRAGGFMTNALDWVSTIRADGTVLDPVGPGRFAPIDPADIAAVAARVLIDDGHAGRTCVLTGGELFTVAEQVQILSKALGRPLAVREVTSAADAVRARFPAGAPPALADAIVDAFTRMRADTVGVRTDTVQHLLGRPPRTFADWCRRHVDAFR